ncbi:MAG: tetratricopeptide repeat protein [Melioribacteraceae bacterium]
MKFKILLIYTAFLLAGCSSDVVKENNSNGKNDHSFYAPQNKKLAQEKFIAGSILELKGQFTEAVIEYLEALKYDPQPGINYTIAKNYYRLNKFSSALTYSQKAVENEPKNTEYLTLQASIYSSSHLEDSAATVYSKIIQLDSTNVTAYYNLAQLNEVKKPSVAILHYKKILDMIGPEWSVLVRIADINERMGNIKETISTVEELLKLNPSDLLLQKLLIESYLKTKDYEKALSKVNESLTSFPDDESLIDLKGRIFIQQGKWQDASNEYMKLVKSRKISIEDKLRIGTSFYFQSEKDSTNLNIAKQIFLEVNRDTLDWQVNAYLGEIELREHKNESAIEYFKTAAKLAEWNAQIWVRLGGLLFDTKKYKDAIEYMSKASEKFPNDFAINLIYGLSLSTENEHIKAKDALEKAYKLNPNDVTVLSALGYTLNQLKNDKEALVHLNKALIIEPNNIQVISVLALIHESQKEYQISDSLYTSALKIDSSNVLIMNNFAYSLAERGIRLQDALTMSKKAIGAEPKNSSYLDTIGWIYFRLGDFKKAKKNIEEAVKLENKNGTLLDHLGDVYFKLGEKSKAVEFWKKVFELDSTKNDIKTKIEKGEL